MSKGQLRRQRRDSKEKGNKRHHNPTTLVAAMSFVAHTLHLFSVGLDTSVHVHKVDTLRECRITTR